MIEKGIVDFWLDRIHNDIGLRDIEMTRRCFYSVSDHAEFFSIDFSGLFAYLINDTLGGDKVLCELVFYIEPHRRGDLKLVRHYIKRAETLAKRESCNKIAIGANIGYKDDSFSKLLLRWGYKTDTAIKEFTYVR